MQRIGRLEYQFRDCFVKPEVFVNNTVICPGGGILGIHVDIVGAVIFPLSGNSIVPPCIIQCAGKMEAVLASAALIVHIRLTQGSKFETGVQIQLVIICAAVDHRGAGFTEAVSGKNTINFQSSCLINILLNINQIAAALEGDGIRAVTGIYGHIVMTLADRNLVIILCRGNCAVLSDSDLVIAAAGRYINLRIHRRCCIEFTCKNTVFLTGIQLHVGRHSSGDIQRIISVTGVDGRILNIRQRYVDSVALRGAVIGEVVSILNLDILVVCFSGCRLSGFLVFLLFLQSQVNACQKQFHVLYADAAFQLDTAGTFSVNRSIVNYSFTINSVGNCRHRINSIGSFVIAVSRIAIICCNRIGFVIGFVMFIGIMCNDVDYDAFSTAAVVNVQATGIGAVLNHNGNVILTCSNGCVHSLLDGIGAFIIFIVQPIAIAGSTGRCITIGGAGRHRFRFFSSFFRISRVSIIVIAAVVCHCKKVIAVAGWRRRTA